MIDLDKEKDKIDYEEVIKVIENNFIELVNAFPVYRAYDIVIANEQYFVKNEEMPPNTIYIVVKFQPATADFGMTVLPLSFDIISEENRISICKSLLEDYVTFFNQTNSGYYQQYYELPSVVSNFNEVYTGYRSLFKMTGIFVVSKLSNSYKLEWFDGEKYQEIELFDSTLNAGMQNVPQAFFGNNNYTKSENQVGTCSINIVSYLLNNSFYNKCLEVWTSKRNIKVINNNFEIKITFKNGSSLIDIYKLVDLSISQKFKQIPTVSITLTN